LIPLTNELIEGQWLFYDEIRDVLIGWKETIDSNENKGYTLKFLPDISKILWIEELENIPEEKEKEKSPVTEADEKQIEEKKRKSQTAKKEDVN